MSRGCGTARCSASPPEDPDRRLPCGTPGHRQVLGGGTVAREAGDLQDGGPPLELRVAEQSPEGVLGDGALAQVGVAVAVGTEGHLRVVEVDAGESVEAERGVEPADEL